MKARVAVLGTVGKSLTIDTEATKGATIGTNLYLPDGSVPTLAQLQALFGDDEQPPFSNTVWKLIQEIPANVKEVEALATSGLVVRQTDGNWLTRSIAVEADGLLQVAQPAGESGNPTLGAASIAALSVWGRASNTAGKPAPIVSAGATDVFRRSGTAVGFGGIDSTYITDFTEAAQDAVLGVIADSARIDFAYDDSLNAFTADLIAGSVSNTYLANMAAATIKGRASGAGTGVPTDLSGAQVATIIGYTAADVLAKLLTVDGAGSGLDADLLDGNSSAAFVLASAYTAADVLAKLITVDGAGSLLDADFLDGIDGSDYARISVANTFQQAQTISSASPFLILLENDQSADEQLWAWSANTKIFALKSYTAAFAANRQQLAFTRGTGAAVTNIAIGNTTDNASVDFLGTGAVSIGGALSVTGLATLNANALLTNANPRLRVLETGLAADTGGWDLNFDAGAMELRTRTDADGAGTNILRALRPSGSTTPQRIFFGGEVTADIAGLSTTAGNVGNYSWIFTNANNSTRACRLLIPSVATTGAGFNTLRYCGTFGSPTQIVNTSLLGFYVLAGYNTATGTIREQTGFIGRALEDWTSTAMGAALDLLSTANGGSTVLTTMRLHGTQAEFLDGTEALPSKTYQNDLDSGEWRIGANNIGWSTNATLAFAIDSAQRIYGKALHNNASSPTGTTNQYIASGTYTPTLNNTTNVAASTASQCQWMRVGNVVTVSGRASVDPTAVGAVVLGISLPLASNFGAVEDCGGTACAPGIAGQSASVSADAANDRAIMEWVAVDITNQVMVFTFTYEII